MRIEVCRSVRKIFLTTMFGLAALALVQTVFAQAQTAVTKAQAQTAVTKAQTQTAVAEGSAKQTDIGTSKATDANAVYIGTVSDPEKGGTVTMTNPATGATINAGTITFRGEGSKGSVGQKDVVYTVIPSGSVSFQEMPLKEALTIAISTSPSEKDLPKVEQLVERTLAINPEVVAARAELQRAQANLNRVQLQIAQNVIALRAHWEVARREVGFLEAKLKEAGDDKAKEEITRAYIRSRAELAQIERQLPILSGALGEKVAAMRLNSGCSNLVRTTGTVGTVNDVCTMQWKNADVVTESGSNVFTGSLTSAASEAKPPKELEMPVAVEFQESPLTDVVAYLHDVTKLNFVIDPEAGMEGRPVTLHFKDVPLKAVLQAIEDTCFPVRFIVRPYGILVTDKDNAAQRFGN